MISVRLCFTCWSLGFSCWLSMSCSCWSAICFWKYREHVKAYTEENDVWSIRNVLQSTFLEHKVQVGSAITVTPNSPFSLILMMPESSAPCWSLVAPSPRKERSTRQTIRAFLLLTCRWRQIIQMSLQWSNWPLKCSLHCSQWMSDVPHHGHCNSAFTNDLEVLQNVKEQMTGLDIERLPNK